MGTLPSVAAIGLGHRGHRYAGQLPRRFWWVAAAMAAGAVALAVLIWAGRPPLPPQARADPPTLRELLPTLTRSGAGPHGVGVEGVYAPPLFFEVTDQAPPPGVLAGRVLVFYLQERVHSGALPATPPAAFLQVDGGERLRPVDASIVQDDIHHRTTRLLFPAIAAGGRPLDLRHPHTLSLLLPMEDGTVSSGNTLVWQLPLDTVPAGTAQGTRSAPAAADTAAAAPPAGAQLSNLARALQRTAEDVQYRGVTGIKVAATYATPDYFAAALTPEAAARYQPEQRPVFVVAENSHQHELPPEALPLVLRVAGRDYRPDLMERRIASPHHRVTMVRFPAEASLTRPPGTMELLLPGEKTLQWRLPIAYPGARDTSPFGMTWASLLAMLGGLLAAMWPCLFQLTAFFIPALAGIGMGEANGKVTLGTHLQVMRAALFFVLGFTLVYTAAGAAIGLAAERLRDTGNFQTWQRAIGIGGGVVILILALRVAAKVRAPLVCKMPVLSALADKRGGASAVDMMLAGLAFATGCMTCFGAALVLTMVVYVGLNGSVAFGALIMFLFALGMGIPLVIAATAMARVLPLLFRLEKLVRWMGVASSLLMVAFAILLISGNYMALTEWAYRLTGFAPSR